MNRDKYKERNGLPGEMLQDEEIDFDSEIDNWFGNSETPNCDAEELYNNAYHSRLRVSLYGSGASGDGWIRVRYNEGERKLRLLTTLYQMEADGTHTLYLEDFPVEIYENDSIGIPMDDPNGNYSKFTILNETVTAINENLRLAGLEPSDASAFRFLRQYAD